MKNLIRAAPIAALIAGTLLSGCKLMPWYKPDPKYRQIARDWDLGKKFKGQLDPDGSNAWEQAIRITLPAKGSLFVTLKASNQSAPLDVEVYAGGNTPLATTDKASDKSKLKVEDMEADTYIVRVVEDFKSKESTSYDLSTIFKPADPDAQSKYKTQETAREVTLDKPVGDVVDYSAMNATHWWKITVPGQGGLQVKFTNKDSDKGAHIDAFLVDPSGSAPIAIDPTVGWKKDDLPAGDYFVKVVAKDAGDAGQYEIRASYKQGDVCKNGGDPCTFSGAEELKLPADNKKSDVDYTKGKAYHFYVLHFKDKGKLALEFKSETKGSKIVAALMKKEDDDPEQFKGAVQKDVTDPGDLYIKVSANDPGDAGKYSIKSIFTPLNVVSFDVLEIANSPCGLTVQGGSNQGVRSGASCTVINAQAQPIDTCMIDQVYPNLSKVRPMGSCSKIPKNGSKVQIQAP